MKKDNILKPAGFLFIISAIVALINFIYNIVMSRMLTLPDFGDLRAIFSIVMIFAVPMSAIRTMMARFTAEYYKTDLEKLKSLSRHTLVFMLALGFGFTFIFAYFSRPISEYLRISSTNLIIFLGPLAFTILILPLILGIYQGLQRFTLLGVSALFNTILKLLLGVFFVYLGFATLGALTGLVLSGIIVIFVFGLMLISLFRKTKGEKESYNRQDIYGYSGYALGVLICFAIISQIDILIVKHKFLPTEAGLYCCAAVIGKGFLFLPVPVVTVLFPKIVENNKMGKSSTSILVQALLISLFLCLMGIAACFFFPHYLIKMFGAKYAQATYLIKLFALAMSPFALFYVLMYYFLSKYRLKFFYYCLLVCIGAIIVLFSLPGTLSQFLVFLGWYGLLIFVLPLIYILHKERKIA